MSLSFQCNELQHKINSKLPEKKALDYEKYIEDLQNKLKSAQNRCQSAENLSKSQLIMIQKLQEEMEDMKVYISIFIILSQSLINVGKLFKHVKLCNN